MRVVLKNEEQHHSFFFFPTVPKLEIEEYNEADSKKNVKPLPPMRTDPPRSSKRKKRAKTAPYHGEIKEEVVKKRKTKSGSGNEEEEDVKKVSRLPARWTAERYEKAETMLMEIVRERGGVRGKPLMRKELRDEARKVIGDTGLLDHLLKHSAGKIVGGGGGDERFMRRHNEEGAMVYWLEPREMVGLEMDDVGGCRECGVECREEIGKLKELVGTLGRELQELQSVKEQEKVTLQENCEKLLKRNLALESNMAGLSNSLRVLKDNHEKLLKRNIKLEAKIEGMSNSFQGLKEEMLLLKRGDKKEEKQNTRKVEIIGDVKSGGDNSYCDGLGELLSLNNENQNQGEKVLGQEMTVVDNGGIDNEGNNQKNENVNLQGHLSLLPKAMGGSDNGGVDKMANTKHHEHHLSMLSKPFCSSQLHLPHPLPC